MKARKSAPKVSVSQRKRWLTLLRQSAGVQGDGSSEHSAPINIVADTNILVSAILFGGKPEKVLTHIIGQNHLVLSHYIVDEFIRTLKHMRPKIPVRWLRQLRIGLDIFCVDHEIDIEVMVRDINDADIIRLAIKEHAVVVSNDKDLLEYKSGAAVTILSVAEYSEIFEI